MNILRNIRCKIWACVSVALLGFLGATLATTWVQNETKVSLGHIQKSDLPLSSKGILVQRLFTAQSEDYEKGLLTRKKGDVQRAIMRHDQITLLLEELVGLARATDNELYPRLLSSRDKYHEYFRLASRYYHDAALKGDVVPADKEVQQLGKLRAGLDAELLQIGTMLQDIIITELDKSYERLEVHTRLLHILFVLVLFVTAVVVNWWAKREIVAPLGEIKKMISDFSRGRTIRRSAVNHGGGEIQELATSFWQMSRELQHITVSRDYVDNIINNMSDSLVILNPDLTIQTVNHATLSLLSVKEEELEGAPFQNVFSHHDEAVAKTLFQGLLEGKPVADFESLYINGKGQAIPVLFSASALYLPDGSLQGISCLAHDISEFKEQRDQLEFLASFDKLTGLPNRDLFFDRLKLTMNEARRYGHLFALLYLDLDHFKALNDKYGHEAGDLALQEVATRLQETVRDTDTVSRLGSDEFTILLSRVHNASDAMKVATKVLAAIAKPFAIEDSICVLGVSIGICLSSPDLTSADTLIKNADTAMSAAKAQGRNRFMFSSSDLS